MAAKKKNALANGAGAKKPGAKKPGAKKVPTEKTGVKRSPLAGKTLPNTSLHALHVYSGPANVALEKVRAICMSLPDAYEKISHGAPWFFAKKGFVAFAEDHHGDGRIGIWVRAAEGAAGMMVESDPDRFYVPPYVGPSGWVGVRLNRKKTNWDEVREIVTDGYVAAGGRG